MTSALTALAREEEEATLARVALLVVGFAAKKVTSSCGAKSKLLCLYWQ